jgi:hemolysin activation/secretion protein
MNRSHALVRQGLQDPATPVPETARAHGGGQAFREGEISADDVQLARAELFWQTSATRKLQWFYDIARVRLNARPWSDGVQALTASGAGLGTRRRHLVRDPALSLSAVEPVERFVLTRRADAPTRTHFASKETW